MEATTNDAVLFIKACKDMQIGSVIFKTKKISLQFNLKLDKEEEVNTIREKSNASEDEDLDLQNLLDPHFFIKNMEANKTQGNK